MRSLIAPHRVNQLHRLLIRFSWTANILLINAAGRLCVSHCVCVCAELRSVNLISVCLRAPLVCMLIHLYTSVRLSNVNVISVCVSVCAHVCVCLWPSAEAGCAGCRQTEICISGSARDLFDLSTYNTSGGLPAENLGRYLISQEERPTHW